MINLAHSERSHGRGLHQEVHPSQKKYPEKMISAEGKNKHLLSTENPISSEGHYLRNNAALAFRGHKTKAPELRQKHTASRLSEHPNIKRALPCDCPWLEKFHQHSFLEMSFPLHQNSPNQYHFVPFPKIETPTNSRLYSMSVRQGHSNALEAINFLKFFRIYELHCCTSWRAQ
jgi:hypothetical protein